MTLDDGIDIITIPDDLEWTDEFGFSPVTQDIRRTIGGSFIISESDLKYGRPITLTGGPEVWMLRSVMSQIADKATVPGKQFTLTLPDGRIYNVIFRRDSGQPFAAIPLWRKRVQGPSEYVKEIVLRFYTVNLESN